METKETLEEVAYNYASKKLQRPITIYTPLESNVAEYCAFIEGAKWQQEQDKNKYSEEEVLNILNEYGYAIINEDITNPIGTVKKWFEQFKNK